MPASGRALEALWDKRWIVVQHVYTRLIIPASLPLEPSRFMELTIPMTRGYCRSIQRMFTLASDNSVDPQARTWDWVGSLHSPCIVCRIC
jgi:hypothetical protein